jgi:hypothetical protein
MTDVYKVLSMIDLTDESNKFNLLKYLLLKYYIEDINKPSKYKPLFDDEEWLIKFFYMHMNCHSKELLTKHQWHDIAEFIWDVIPDDVKSHDKFKFTLDSLHKMVDNNIKE